MKPSEVLVQEHEIIGRVLDGAERMVRGIEATGEVPVEKVRQVMAFVREFADGCHHAKEENLLFERMHLCGMPVEQGPIAVMNHEHEMGRAYMRALADALARVEQGDGAAAHEVAISLTSYVELLRAHIFKENNILFPMADNLFSPRDQADLTEAFARVDADAADLRARHIAFAEGCP